METYWISWHPFIVECLRSLECQFCHLMWATTYLTLEQKGAPIYCAHIVNTF